MKSLLEIISDEKPFSRWGLLGGLHYLFWRVYHGYYVWILFNVVWRYRVFSPLARWTQKRHAQKASIGLSKVNRGKSVWVKNPRVEVIDRSFKGD